MENVQIRIHIEDDADLAAAESLANDLPEVKVVAISSTPTGDVEGLIEPVTAVLIGAGAALVAKFVMDWWEKVRGGLVVDMRPDAKDEIYRDRDVPYGFILTFTADGGEVKLDARDTPKDSVHQLLDAVISGAFSTASTFAEAAKTMLPNASIEETSVKETT